MQQKNRFLVCIKRIFSMQLYLIMLLLLCALTVTYHLLPTKQQETEIRVALFSEEDSRFNENLISSLQEGSPLFKFYAVSDKDTMVQDVKSGYAECGFFIPQGFVSSYAAGTHDLVISEYVLPATTLQASVSEVLFSHLLKLSGAQVLSETLNNRELTDLIRTYYDEAFSTDNAVSVTEVVAGPYHAPVTSKKVNLPIFEFLCLILVLSSLLSVLIVLRDEESGKYVSLSTKDKTFMRLFFASAALLPVLILGSLSLLITGAPVIQILLLLLITVGLIPCAAVLSLGMKKSTSLLKVLPFVVLFTLILLLILSLSR